MVNQMIRIPEGCVLWLDLTEPTGNVVYDHSGHGNNGKVYGAVLEKRLQYIGRKFDGVDDKIDCGNDESLDITEEMTIEVWFYYKGYTSYPRLVSKGHNSPWSVFFDDDNTIFVIVDNYEEGRHQVSITPNTWQYFAWRYYKEEGVNKAEYYINGESKLTLSGLPDIPSNPTQKVGIGDEIETGFNRPFYGVITHVGLYNRALHPSEIKHLYEEFQKRVFRRIDPLNIRMR